MRGFVKFEKKIYIDIYIIRTKFHRFFFESKFFKGRLLLSYVERYT